METYIHYGHDKFDIDKFEPVVNIPDWVKPMGGLWASRKNARFGWKDWVSYEVMDRAMELLSTSFEFCIKPTANVYKIYTTNDIFALPKQDTKLKSRYPIDFEQCLANGIDAIELYWFYKEHYVYEEKFVGIYLYGWDCDSIIIMNPDIVCPL